MQDETTSITEIERRSSPEVSSSDYDADFNPLVYQSFYLFCPCRFWEQMV